MSALYFFFNVSSSVLASAKYLVIFILHVKLYLTISLNFMMSCGSSSVDAAENLKFLYMQDPFHLNYLSLISVELV